MTKYRSKFEASLARELRGEKVSFKYEDETLAYVVPESTHTYTPDFFLLNGIIIEAKGKLDPDTRKKMILVRDQNPDKDIRFVFMRAKNPIRKGSKTTYAMWAEKNGFKWADGSIPKEWINE